MPRPAANKKLKMARLARECAKLDPIEERALAEEGISEDLRRWPDYRLENDPRFLQRIAEARQSLKAGLGVWYEELKEDLAALEERADEPSIPFSKVVKQLKRKGKL